jgi:hypothetical protein
MALLLFGQYVPRLGRLAAGLSTAGGGLLWLALIIMIPLALIGLVIGATTLAIANAGLLLIIFVSVAAGIAIAGKR